MRTFSWVDLVTYIDMEGVFETTDSYNAQQNMRKFGFVL